MIDDDLIEYCLGCKMSENREICPSTAQNPQIFNLPPEKTKKMRKYSYLSSLNKWIFCTFFLKKDLNSESIIKIAAA